MSRIQRALISVTDKTGVVDFARALSSLGVEVLSTGGTYRVLKEAGIAPLREVADVTGFPEMLDGRVKTIHPRIAQTLRDAGWRDTRLIEPGESRLAGAIESLR